MDELQTQGKQSPENHGEDAKPKNSKPSFWKRRPVVIVCTTVLAGLFFFGLTEFAESLTHESTDDAFLSANVVSLAPQVAGKVKQVYVRDNQAVRAGDPLVELDPRDFEIQVAQKKAAQKSAEANVQLLEASIQMLTTQVATAEATAKQSEAEAASDKAQADLADANLKRAENLIEKKITSAQEFDAAKAAAAAADATLRAGQEKAASDRAKVAQTKAQLEAGRKAWERAQAQARESAVDVQQAELNLSYTSIPAPQDGRVTRKAVEAGDYVQVGQRLMAIVPNELWVTANFKETQITNIRTNQTVEISVDSVAGRTFAGHVDSIQSGSGAAFSLLPPENAVGNYVKVVQRVPVKIVFDRPIEVAHVLGPGMSAVPSVHVTDYEVPEIAVILVAMLLAVGVGIFWWRFATLPPADDRRQS